MKPKKVASLTVEIYQLENGDFEPRFPDPKLDVTTRYDYTKLALLAGEFLNYVKSQLVVLNADEDGKIKKLSNIIIDAKGWNEMMDQRKQDSRPDVEKYQQPLPFKPGTGAGGQVVDFQQREE